ncbi:MAG: PAS domain-containing protein [Hyphomicrobiales bacterium]|nr:PAS domain-containing protein [Hyphomicrobiales bacterium]MCP5001373.1 PAS domain-containing protein [Hyphomicrobiales bacterium]
MAYGEQKNYWHRRIGSKLSGFTLIASTALSSSAWAQTPTGEPSPLSEPASGLFVNSFEVMNFALVIGAVSAAMISAIWLIRERGKISLDNTQLRTSLSDANTEIARYKALIVEKDRSYVIWDGQSAAQFLGSLPLHTGVPRANRDLLAFGRWLEPASAARIEHAIDSLRAHANSFDIEIETQRGHLLEAQGRTSGGRAFVRFAALANVRAELAGLKAERDRLTGAVETLRSLLDSVDMPAWLRDANGKLSWVNQAYVYAVEAKDSADAVDRGLEVLDTQTRERVRAERLPDRPFVDRISTVVRGNRTFFEVTDATSVTGSAGLGQDVTEAEAIREELKRTIASHSETLDHLATPVAIFDREQRLQFYNQSFQSLWELDTPFLAAKPTNSELLERLRAEGRLPEPGAWRDWKEEILSVYQSVDPQPDLWHLPDGQTLNVFANVHPRGGVTWVFENLTEKYDLETRYNTLVKVQGETIDYLAEGVCVFGADGKLRLSNPAFRALWAIPEKAAQAGAHINEIADICKPSYDEADGWAHFSSVITGYDEERQTHEGRLELHSGLVLDYAIVPLPDAQMMLTFVNVTDSAKVEKALTDKNDALRKADVLKNDFVQHVSYELRSPLTNIIGFTDLLKTPQIGELNDQQAEYVDHISTSSALLLTIVNDILDLATVDAGIMQLDMNRLDLHELIDEVVGLIDARLRENNIALEIDIDEKAGVITADAQRLKQILFKLLSNAANYAPEGSAVNLSCRREGGEIVFSVSDSGPGIPGDVLKTVFNRFEAHNGTGRRSGAGLGLSIVDSFVSLHNGSVTVSSDEGSGTRVVCRLPDTPPLPSQAAE